MGQLIGPDKSLLKFQEAVKKHFNLAILNVELEAIEEKVKHAWRLKDYKAIVEAYEPYETHLDLVQLKRLQYAKKMLSHNLGKVEK